jgi:hypothetical protein
MESSKEGFRRKVSRRTESWRGICFVTVGDEAAWGRICRASERRAARVSVLEECVRRVVMRVVREAVRVWVADGWVSMLDRCLVRAWVVGETYRRG